MIKELFSEDVVDITMFLKEKKVGKAEDYIINYDYVLEQFNARAIRKSFFDDELVAYAQVDDDEEIQDIILVDIKGEDNFNFCNISLCNFNNTELMKYMLENIWERRENLLKVKFVINGKSLTEETKQHLLDIGFEKEICLRKCDDEDKSIYEFSFFKK